MGIQLTQYCIQKTIISPMNCISTFVVNLMTLICMSLFLTSLFCSLFCLFLLPPMLDYLNYCSFIVCLGLIWISICILNLSTQHLTLKCPEYFSPCSSSIFELIQHCHYFKYHLFASDFQFYVSCPDISLFL